MNTTIDNLVIFDLLYISCGEMTGIQSDMGCIMSDMGQDSGKDKHGAIFGVLPRITPTRAQTRGKHGANTGLNTGLNHSGQDTGQIFCSERLRVTTSGYFFQRTTYARSPA